MAWLRTAIFAAALFAVHGVSRSEVSPVASVIKLLERLEKQTMEEGKAEAAAYDKFACFCKEQSDEKLYSITKKGQKIELLTSEIKAHASVITNSNKQIADLNENIEKLKADAEKDQKSRDAEFAKYNMKRKDLADAVKGCDEAIEMLKAGKTPAALIQEGLVSRKVASLLQVAAPPAGSKFHSGEILEVMQGTLKKFKVNKADLDKEESEKKHTFNMKQGARMNQIKALEDNLRQCEMETAQKQEKQQIAEEDKAKTAEDRKSDQTFMDDLTEQCEEKAKAWDARSKTRANELTAIDSALSTLKGEVSGNYAANKKLVGLVSNHRTVSEVAKHGHWEWVVDNVQEVAPAKDAAPAGTAEAKADDTEESADADDAEATDAETTDAESTDAEGTEAEAADTEAEDAEAEDAEGADSEEESGQESDAAEQYYYTDEDVGFLQKAQHVKHVKHVKHHRHRKSSHRAIVLKKLMAFLKSKNKILKSDAISNLMLRMKADHFAKVRDMVKDLIAKLEADAANEADQKGWCDGEMEKATSSRDEMIAAMEQDNAQKMSAKAAVEKLKEEIEDLNKEIADMRKGLNEATQLRVNEKKENLKTLADANAGLVGVTRAMKILKDFYDGALLQTQYKPPKSDASGNTVSDLAPDTFEGDYSGNQAASTGIIGQLDVIKSDFEGTIDSTKAAEEEAESKFDDYQKEAETDIKEKSSVIKAKESEKGNEKADLSDYNDNLQGHAEMKSQALEELAKLKPACVDTGSSYKEKVARREQEIESLKGAYNILDEMH